MTTTTTNTENVFKLPSKQPDDRMEIHGLSRVQAERLLPANQTSAQLDVIVKTYYDSLTRSERSTLAGNEKLSVKTRLANLKGFVLHLRKAFELQPASAGSATLLFSKHRIVPKTYFFAANERKRALAKLHKRWSEEDSSAHVTTRGRPDLRDDEERQVKEEAKARAQRLAEDATREWIDVERELAPLAREYLNQTDLTYTAWSCRRLVESLAQIYLGLDETCIPRLEGLFLQWTRLQRAEAEYSAAKAAYEDQELLYQGEFGDTYARENEAQREVDAAAERVRDIVTSVDSRNQPSDFDKISESMYLRAALKFTIEGPGHAARVNERELQCHAQQKAVDDLELAMSDVTFAASDADREDAKRQVLQHPGLLRNPRVRELLREFAPAPDRISDNSGGSRVDRVCSPVPARTRSAP